MPCSSSTPLTSPSLPPSPHPQLDRLTTTTAAMAPNREVTPGTVARIHAGQVKFNPCVQVVDVKKIQPNPGQSTGQDRYRLIISDGTHYQQAMLATQLNELVTSNQIVSYGLISLVDFICNEVQNKKIVIILKCEVVDASLGYKIGDPVEFGKAGAGGSGGGETVAAAPYQTKQEAPSLNTMAGASVPYKPAASSHGGGGVSGGGYQSNPYGGGGGGGYRAPAGPVVRAPINQSIIPIGDLNPYQNRWVIKARVTAKTDIKRWSNAKGEGTLFSIDMLDEGGGEMRATFFKEACEKFYPILEQGHVYTFSGGKLKVAQRQYSSIRNTYEATFDSNSEILEVPDDKNILTAVYSFKKIGELEQTPPNSTIDLIGVVKAFSPLSTITTKKDGREVAKRELTICDDSGTEVRLTLWGDKASNNPEQWENHPIVAFKGLKVSDYNGRSLGTMPASQVVVAPDLPEAHTLHHWWHAMGATSSITSISSGGGGGGGGGGGFADRKVLAQIKEEQLGFGEKPDYLDVKATLTYIKSDPDPWYKSCTSPECKRKVTEQMNSYYCEKCQKEMPECAYRYILSLSATDHSGSVYFSCFDDHANVLLGKTAEELHSFKSSDMQARYDATFQEANFGTHIFRLRVKAEQVNDEQRVKNTVMNVRPVNLAQESRDLIAAIKAYN